MPEKTENKAKAMEKEKEKTLEERLVAGEWVGRKELEQLPMKVVVRPFERHILVHIERDRAWYLVEYSKDGKRARLRGHYTEYGYVL